MGYKSAVDAIKNKCSQAKGNLYFDIGTAKDFNSDDNRDFPLVYIRRPITSSKVKNSNNIIVQEVFNISIQVLQTCPFTESSDNVERYFQDTNYILDALLNDLLAQDFQLTTGTAFQLYKKTDLVVVGWEMPIQLTVDVDPNLCCSYFD